MGCTTRLTPFLLGGVQATVPCSPTRCRNELLNYKLRRVWDTVTLTDVSDSSVRVWHGGLDNGINLGRTVSKSAAGGAISGREFIDLGRTRAVGAGWLHVAQSVESPDHPEVMLCPCPFLMGLIRTRPCVSSHGNLTPIPLHRPGI